MSDKVYISANSYLSDTWRLAAAIRKSGWRPDVLIALWRGGTPVGVAVHEFFKTTGWDVEHFPLKCGSYTAIGENDGEVKFSFADDAFGSLKVGSRVLVVDDVFDSGKTAVAIREKLRNLPCGAVEMRFAAVYWKPEKNTTDMTPDYCVNKVGNDWLVFPHEIEGLTAAEVAEKDPELAKILEGFG